MIFPAATPAGSIGGASGSATCFEAATANGLPVALCGDPALGPASSLLSPLAAALGMGGGSGVEDMGSKFVRVGWIVWGRCQCNNWEKSFARASLLHWGFVAYDCPGPGPAPLPCTSYITHIELTIEVKNWGPSRQRSGGKGH